MQNTAPNFRTKNKIRFNSRYPNASSGTILRVAVAVPLVWITENIANSNVNEVIFDILLQMNGLCWKIVFQNGFAISIEVLLIVAKYLFCKAQVLKLVVFDVFSDIRPLHASRNVRVSHNTQVMDGICR